MRTNGRGNDRFMTLAVVAIAFAVGAIVSGGPAELTLVLNELVHSVVEVSTDAVGVLIQR